MNLTSFSSIVSYQAVFLLHLHYKALTARILKLGFHWFHSFISPPPPKKMPWFSHFIWHCTTSWVLKGSVSYSYSHCTWFHLDFHQLTINFHYYADNGVMCAYKTSRFQPAHDSEKTAPQIKKSNGCHRVSCKDTNPNQKIVSFWSTSAPFNWFSTSVCLPKLKPAAINVGVIFGRWFELWCFGVLGCTMLFLSTAEYSETVFPSKIIWQRSLRLWFPLCHRWLQLLLLTQ